MWAARLWERGLDVPLPVSSKSGTHVLGLPQYAWNRTDCWIDPVRETSHPPQDLQLERRREEEAVRGPEQLFYSETWDLPVPSHRSRAAAEASEAVPAVMSLDGAAWRGAFGSVCADAGELEDAARIRRVVVLHALDAAAARSLPETQMCVVARFIAAVQAMVRAMHAASQATGRARSLRVWVVVDRSCHNYIGHNYEGHNYIGHDYVGHD